MTLCDHGFLLFGWLVLFPLTGYTPDSSCAAYWVTFCPFQCSICMENNDWWTLGVVSLLCSQSAVPFSACLGNLTWPALRMGSELFLGDVLVTLAVEFESWPWLQVTESSRLWAETGSLIYADDCMVGSGGSQQLCEGRTSKPEQIP